MKYLTAIALYFFFGAMASLSWAYGLIALLWDPSIIARIAQANDRTTAAMLPFGWSGRKTVSRECGEELKSGTPCRFCRIVCKVLSYKILGRWYVLEPDHCSKKSGA